MSITLQDIKNQHYKYRYGFDGALPPIQTFIQHLRTKFGHQESIDGENHLVHLLFHYTSLPLLLR
jgi:hypothetical protein